MDRVSNLPDEIRCHILSFLPTKQAALTSALSKSWRNLWKLVPNLDIDDSEFLHPEVGKGERDEIRQSFVDFVDGVLTLQGDSPIDKFSLKCITRVHPSCVNRWIRNVLQRGVSDLTLFTDFSSDDSEEEGYNLPEDMFSSRKLVQLKIRSENCVDWLWRRGVGSASLLPMLKTLDIDSDLIFCGKVELLLRSFPVLEELRLANTEWTDLDESISSAILRKLSLSINLSEDEEFGNPKSISFDTPSLLYLNYADLVAEDYPLVNMGKLFEARINLMLATEDQVKRVRAPNHDLLEGDIVLKFGNAVKLMNGIKNVQKLSLTADTLEVLSLCCESMPVFKNLKMLGIESEEGRGWQAMPVLLRNCPHLETLIIEGLLHYETDKCGDACDCISREDKGHSLTSCPVKMIEIQGFRGTVKEMTMIKHFLVYFPCLKEMKIYVAENGPTDLRFPQVSDLIEQLMEEYNKSSSCNVELLVSDILSEKWTAEGRIL
ncbi:PREDICTED: F-box/LRR-repeat protein At3g58930-like [Camelina sativa]|uniref:F-box/LRR-repeat protein At3g58930-like n=1 Tax=Camelina sativa TaxID=90675 RepID=A0ABM0Z907_CAMSA|nr:PREDICTED: F-box/LRR-repeat protein At3g58930-like [Camelina sativa]XP_010512121.1 PREDICTED: F-box/LRR-repeat protein At3g58930-like [Camelina sativa]